MNRKISKLFKKSFSVLSAFTHRIIQFVIGDNKYYEWLSLKESRYLHKNYSSEKSRAHQASKTIILMFDGKTFPAGLADRIRSIVSIYYWSKCNQVSLKIHFKHPFDLCEYLEPNEYDWRIDDSDISFNSDDSMPIAFFSQNKLFSNNNVEVQKCFADKHLNLSYKQIHVYSNAYFFDDFFYKSYHELFKPTVRLQNLINDSILKINGKYISISYRFTKLLGDLEDIHGKELSAKKQSILIKKCLDLIPILYSKTPNLEKIFITSDSVKFLDIAAATYPYVYIAEGAVGHIAFGDNSQEIGTKAFLDLMLISQAEKAYMARTEIMYNSGFAKRAAMIGNIPFEEILIK